MFCKSDDRTPKTPTDTPQCTGPFSDARDCPVHAPKTPTHTPSAGSPEQAPISRESTEFNLYTFARAPARLGVVEWQAIGAQYLPLDGAVDGLLLHRGKTFIVDWKSPGATLTDTQAKLSASGWPIVYLSTVDQVKELLT